MRFENETLPAGACFVPHLLRKDERTIRCFFASEDPGRRQLGDFFLPHEAKLTEAAVNRLPDGSWLTISRQENRGLNYMFAASPDGRTWTAHEYRPHVVNGTNSKPIFEHFDGVYYLGWNEATQINGAFRSVFNLDVSRDGLHWERKYRFETDKSFQYPTLHDYQGTIYLTVTQGDHSPSRKERIMFGKLDMQHNKCKHN